MNIRDFELQHKINRYVLLSVFFVLLFSPLLFSGEFDGKVEFYRRELRKNPKNIEAMLEVAKYLSWNGDLGESIRYYKEILRLNPHQVEAELGLAAVYSWQKKYDESIRTYRKIVEKFPDNVDALSGLARVQGWKGDYKAAVETYQKALKLDPKHHESLVGLGRVYSWNKDYKSSETHYKQLLNQSPKDLEALHGLANTYKWSKQYTKGIEIELKILEIEPANVDSMLSIGYMYGELGAIGQSIHWYQKASKLAPERADILAYLGVLYTYNQQLDSAVTSLKKSIALSERSADSASNPASRTATMDNYLSLGRIYSWQNKSNEAEKLYLKALEINPQSAGAYAGLGQLYYFNGQWDKSIRNYEKSLQLDPLYIESLQGLQRVKLLKAPAFTSRYSFSMNDYRDTETAIVTNREYVNSVSNEFIYKVAPGHEYEGRVRLAQTAFNNLHPQPKDRDYLYNEYTFSLRADHPIWKDRLFFSGRYDQEIFVEYKGPMRYHMPKGEEWLPAGYALLRYEKDRLLSVLSVSVEPVVLTRSELILVDPLYTYSASAGYDLTDHLSFISNYFFQDFQHGRKIGDRSIWEEIFQYRLPFFRQIELGYQFHYLTNPNVVRHIGISRFTERFFKEKLLTDFSYELQEENASENFGLTHKHIFRWLNSYKLTDWLHWSADASIQLNGERDRDRFQTYRTYLTLYWDRDAIRGRYDLALDQAQRR